MAGDKKVLRELLDSEGRTYAAEAGIHLKNTPQPLYRTLVLASLLSARIRASVAVATTRALHDAGLRDPRRMADATWQQRVDALGEGGYRRYDERTATQLGDGARMLLDDWDGDLRRMREQANGDETELRALLRRTPASGRPERASSCARSRTSGRSTRRSWTPRPSRARNAWASRRTPPP